MKVDTLLQLGAPAVCVVQPYGGMDSAQREGYLT